MLCLAMARIRTVSEIARIDREVAKGAQIRARVQCVEEGENLSAFFFSAG